MIMSSKLFTMQHFQNSTRQLNKRLLNTLFPAHCLLCSQPGDNCYDLCQACLASLVLNNNACYCCAQPLSQNQQNNYCGACLSNTPLITRTQAPFIYQTPLDYLIIQLKYHARLTMLSLLAKLLLANITVNSQADCIMPIPLHKSRLRQRGFNQALEIARIVSRQLTLPLNHQQLVRIRNTPPQVQAAAADRQKNIAAAFAVTTPVTAKNIILLDDVITSGSTVREAAKMLFQAGAASVECWAIAKTA